MAQHDVELQELIAAGRKIEAIRLYRDRYGVGLKEAKDAVEAMERGEPPPPVPPVPPSALADDHEVAALIDPLLRSGQLIQAIKVYRERRPVGLKEAKDIIDARAAELGPAVGSAQPAIRPRGDKGLLNCAVILLLVLALAWVIYRMVVGW